MQELDVLNSNVLATSLNDAVRQTYHAEELGIVLAKHDYARVAASFAARLRASEGHVALSRKSLQAA